MRDRLIGLDAGPSGRNKTSGHPAETYLGPPKGAWWHTRWIVGGAWLSMRADGRPIVRDTDASHGYAYEGQSGSETDGTLENRAGRLGLSKGLVYGQSSNTRAAMKRTRRDSESEWTAAADSRRWTTERPE